MRTSQGLNLGPPDYEYYCFNGTSGIGAVVVATATRLLRHSLKVGHGYYSARKFIGCSNVKVEAWCGTGSFPVVWSVRDREELPLVGPCLHTSQVVLVEVVGLYVRILCEAVDF